VNIVDPLTLKSEKATVRTSIVNGITVILVSVPLKEATVKVESTNGFAILYAVTNTGKPQQEENPIARRTYPSPNQRTAANTPLGSSSAGTSMNVASAENAVSPSSGKFLKDLEGLITLSKTQLSHPLIREAIKYYGIAEIPGSTHNSTIVGFFKNSGNRKIRTDEDAWCSVFMSVCATQAGLEGSNHPLARKWLNEGTAVDDPVPGDVVIFWREDISSYKGHVGIYLGETSDGVICLGGNQSDKVCVKVYNKAYVLGYRRL
jgi:uncharacterized protein (TIGR02594 family)